MNNVWSMIINYLLSAVSLGMTFLYGSTGEILTEKSGHSTSEFPESCASEPPAAYRS